VDAEGWRISSRMPARERSFLSMAESGFNDILTDVL
jgi:hypothetical protein